MKRIFIISALLIVLIAPESNAQNKFSTDSLIIYMKKIGVKHLVIALQQAKVETGHFTAPRFTKDHNVFGMQYAKNRKKTAIGKNGDYSTYDSWKKSVEDYYLWQNQFGKLTGEENYKRLLVRRKYNLNKNYMKTVLAVYITEHEMDLINAR